MCFCSKCTWLVKLEDYTAKHQNTSSHSLNCLTYKKREDVCCKFVLVWLLKQLFKKHLRWFICLADAACGNSPLILLKKTWTHAVWFQFFFSFFFCIKQINLSIIQLSYCSKQSSSISHTNINLKSVKTFKMMLFLAFTLHYGHFEMMSLHQGEM